MLFLKIRKHLQLITLFCPFVFELITLETMFSTYRYHCSKELLIAARVYFCSKSSTNVEWNVYVTSTDYLLAFGNSWPEPIEDQYIINVGES